MQSRPPTQFARFLEEELAIPADAVALALRHSTPIPEQLPIILWQYGLISLEQLDRFFDWLEHRPGQFGFGSIPVA